VSVVFLNPTIKKCWVVLTQLWVKYGQTQPLGYIFNPKFGAKTKASVFMKCFTALI